MPSQPDFTTDGDESNVSSSSPVPNVLPERREASLPGGAGFAGRVGATPAVPSGNDLSSHENLAQVVANLRTTPPDTYSVNTSHASDLSAVGAGAASDVAARPGAFPSLVNIAGFVTPPETETQPGTTIGNPASLVTRVGDAGQSQPESSALNDTLGRRLYLQDRAADLMPYERVSKCWRYSRREDRETELWHLPEKQRARFGGLQTCGSLWMCPVCAPFITEGRRAELAAFIKACEAEGYFIGFITYTVPHRASDGLLTLVDGLLQARRKVSSGNPWKRIVERFGILGSIKTIETTYGLNGWHPHLHELVILDRCPNLVELNRVLFERWRTKVQALGLGTVLEGRGCRVECQRGRSAEYLTKMGYTTTWGVEHEMTKATVKRGRSDHRTSMQLLTDYADAGDVQAGKLWQVYAHAFKGRHQLQWTPGARELRRRLLPDLAEKTDQELAEAPNSLGVHMGNLTASEMLPILRLRRRKELLNVAGQGDMHQVRLYAARIERTYNESLKRMGIDRLPVTKVEPKHESASPGGACLARPDRTARGAGRGRRAFNPELVLPPLVLFDVPPMPDEPPAGLGHGKS